MSVALKNMLFGLCALVVLVAVGILFGNDSRTPVGGSEQVTLSTGATKRVAEGRAQLWLGEVNGAHETSDGKVKPAVEFELTCGETTQYGWAFVGESTDEICGFRVQLIEQLDTVPPSARLKVSWSQDVDNLQAASQAFSHNDRSRATP